MTVHAPKIEHHEVQVAQFVPIFTELRPSLMAASEQAKAGTENEKTPETRGLVNSWPSPAMPTWHGGWAVQDSNL
ncbi:MAG TPA: hypothetical protein VFW23_14065 [Tepidisphaeraceae bacterium]|nr:hypothetical protein [Tepidisphaeraceae bacterium]